MGFHVALTTRKYRCRVFVTPVCLSARVCTLLWQLWTAGENKNWYVISLCHGHFNARVWGWWA